MILLLKMFGIILCLILVAEAQQLKLDDTRRDILYDILYYALSIDDDVVNPEVDPPQTLNNFDLDNPHKSEKSQLESESEYESSEENYSNEPLERKRNLFKLFDIGRPRPDGSTKKIAYAGEKSIIKNTPTFPPPYRYYDDLETKLRPYIENDEMVQPDYNSPVFRNPWTISPIYRSVNLKTQINHVPQSRPIQDTKKKPLKFAPSVLPPTDSHEKIRETIHEDNRKEKRIRPSAYGNVGHTKKSIYEDPGLLTDQSSSRPSGSQQTKFLINMLLKMKKGVSKTWAGAKGVGGETIQGTKDLYNRMKSCVKSGIKCLLASGNYFVPKDTGSIVADSKSV